MEIKSIDKCTLLFFDDSGQIKHDMSRLTPLFTEKCDRKVM